MFKNLFNYLSKNLFNCLAINKFSLQSILHPVVPKPKVDFVRELISTKIIQLKKVLSITDVMSDFIENLNIFTKENFETIEKLALSRSEYEHWFRNLIIPND